MLQSPTAHMLYLFVAKDLHHSSSLKLRSVLEGLTALAGICSARGDEEIAMRILMQVREYTSEPPPALPGKPIYTTTGTNHLKV